MAQDYFLHPPGAFDFQPLASFTEPERKTLTLHKPAGRIPVMLRPLEKAFLLLLVLVNHDSTKFLTLRIAQFMWLMPWLSSVAQRSVRWKSSSAAAFGICMSSVLYEGFSTFMVPLSHQWWMSGGSQGKNDIGLRSDPHCAECTHGCRRTRKCWKWGSSSSELQKETGGKVMESRKIWSL